MTATETRPGMDLTGLPMVDPISTMHMANKKRGINLGCGTIILPCERPRHHQSIPEAMYTDPAIAWDNVDRNAEPGVSHVVDLFTYPWALESNAYDVAICAHIVEHIPHHIIWNGADWGEFSLKQFAYSPDVCAMIGKFGQVIPHHPLYQDGWFAWFSELYRIMKPGGLVYVLCPYAWSHGGISDPTHTRYLTLATFNYFNNATDDDPVFRYRMEQQWKMDLTEITMAPHDMAVAEAESRAEVMRALMGLLSFGKADLDTELLPLIYQMSHRQINAMTEFMVTMEAVKDAPDSEKRSQAGSGRDEPAADSAGSENDVQAQVGVVSAGDVD